MIGFAVSCTLILKRIHEVALLNQVLSGAGHLLIFYSYLDYAFGFVDHKDDFGAF